MRSHSPTAAAVLVLLGANLPAQTAKVLDLRDVATALAAREPTVEGVMPPVQRLVRLVSTHWQAQAPDRPNPDRRTLLQALPKDARLLVSCDEERMAFLDGVVEQLRKPDVPELRLQGTLLRLPRQVAVQHGLAAGKATPVDEVLAGRVQKDVVQAGGTLQNLPEAKVLPLVPFRIEPLVDERRPLPASAQIRVRGEAVLTGEREALLAVQLANQDLPEDPTILPSAPLLDLPFVVAAGSGVMLVPRAKAGEREDAEIVVLWLRLVEIGRKPVEVPKDPGK